MNTKLRDGELIHITGTEQRRVELEEKNLIARFLEEWSEEE